VPPPPPLLCVSHLRSSRSPPQRLLPLAECTPPPPVGGSAPPPPPSQLPGLAARPIKADWDRGSGRRPIRRRAPGGVGGRGGGELHRARSEQEPSTRMRRRLWRCAAPSGGRGRRLWRCGERRGRGEQAVAAAAGQFGNCGRRSRPASRRGRRSRPKRRRTWRTRTRSKRTPSTIPTSAMLPRTNFSIQIFDPNCLLSANYIC